MIFPATRDDAREIADLWNHYVRSTTATFRSELYTEQDIIELMQFLSDEDKPFFIARNETLLGFALYKQFRGGDGYRYTMEHSIYLASSAKGRGIGRKFMDALERHANFRHVHALIGGVTADNADSIGFHERMGFQAAATLPQAGFKFDRWHDLTFMQKILEDDQ